MEGQDGAASNPRELDNGSLVAWGSNGWGECDVAALPPGHAWIGVHAGDQHTIARYGLAASVTSAGAGSGQTGMPNPREPGARDARRH
jgi:hypothetical protein